jgi:hypothetical protein
MSIVGDEITVWSDWDGGWWARGHRSGDGLASVDEALARAIGRALSLDEQDLARELARLYQSELNARVTLASGGWLGEIGNGGTRFPEATPSAVPLRVLLDWIPSAVCRAFPESSYAERFTSR